MIKYWFSVSFEEQRRRFEARNAEPLKRWKLSDMDLAEHELYVRYSMAKDTTFQYTDIKQAPWYVVPSDDKRAARLNCISHLLSQFDYEDVAPDVVELPEMRDVPYVRPPMHEQTFVPEVSETAGFRSSRRRRNRIVSSIESCHRGVEGVVLARPPAQPAVHAGLPHQAAAWSAPTAAGRSRRRCRGGPAPAR